MAGPRVVINSLERGSSDDIMKLQALQQRSLVDALGQLAALRVIMGSGAPVDTLPQSFTMGLECRVSGQNIQVMPGILGSFDLYYPTPETDPVESVIKLGVNRDPLLVPVPATASTAMILEARVIDETTVEETRDIFDPGTQTFVPTANTPKRVERLIEFQVVQGTGPIFPEFTGSPWVPILGFFTVGGGVISPIPHGNMLDLRPDLKGLLADDPLRYSYSAGHPEGVLYSQALHSENPANSGFEMGGLVVGRIGRHQMWFRADEGIAPQADSTISGSTEQLNHIYLCPILSNGHEIAPVRFNAIHTGTMRGVLVRSTVPPMVGHRANSAEIILTGSFANFDGVPAGRALHVASIYRESSTSARWFSQDSAGHYKMQCHTASPLYRFLDESGSVAVNTDFPIDFTTLIPANARTVKISISLLATTGAITLAIRPDGGALTTDNYPQDVLMVVGGYAGESKEMVIDLPVRFGVLSGDDGKKWIVRLVPLSTSNCTLRASIIGWSF